MEIKQTTLEEVQREFGELKPDLIDPHAHYLGAYILDELVGIVGYVEHTHVLYLCHDYVKESHRGMGIYKLLCDYRDIELQGKGKTQTAHCNTNSIKQFFNMGYKIEKALFKVVKDC